MAHHILYLNPDDPQVPGQAPSDKLNDLYYAYSVQVKVALWELKTCAIIVMQMNTVISNLRQICVY